MQALLRNLGGALLAVFLCAACKEQPAATEASAFALRTTRLTIASQSVTAEIADTPATMQTGLMYRKEMAPDHGMIFVFPSERQASFWMHNTNLPLDIAYLDRTGKILEVHAATPRDDTPLPSATANIAYALEMNQGWFKQRNIPPGTVVGGLPAFPARK